MHESIKKDDTSSETFKTNLNQNNYMPKSKYEYIFAFDRKIKRRVVHVLKNGYAISLVTGNKFRYPKKRKRVKKRR